MSHSIPPCRCCSRGPHDPSPGGDQYWSSVVLLVINDNQADTTTTFDDQSNSNHTVTPGGNVQYDTAQAPTGMTSSGLFDAAGDYLSIGQSADFAFAGDFTLEAMIRINGFTLHNVVFNWGNFAPVAFVRMTQVMCWYNAGFSDLGTTTLSTNTWYHVAWVRSGTTITAYLDGVAQSTPITDSISTSGTVEIRIGNDSGIAYMDGWLSNVRMTKGVARYTAAFTPPALPLPTS